MAVDKHPSRMPTPPRKPPATSTTDGTMNKMRSSASGQGGVEYGFRHELQVKSPNSSEMAHHFGSSEGKAPRAGKEQSQEGGRKERASRPGDENSRDEPG
jgi:hypothetical protein